MKIDLTNVLSEQHIPIDGEYPFEASVFQFGEDIFPVLKKSPVQLKITCEKERVLSIKGQANVVFGIPCARCLQEVPVKIILSFDRQVDLDRSTEDELYEETNYIDGYMLDADGLLYKELLIEWPTKVLCKPDCKGICNVCGQNLNEGTCDCRHEEQLDPRMSAIRDIFKNSKEV